MIDGVVRYASGRINNAEMRKLAAQAAAGDTAPPSYKILRERQLFNAKCFKGGGQAQHAGDAIGQLWLVGKLDCKGWDDTKLLDAARRWWRGREEVLKDVAVKTARYERASRSSSSSAKPNKLERDYYRYESFLLDASDYDCECLADLMQPTLDSVPALWVRRIIETEVLRHFLLPTAELACVMDYDRLQSALSALRAMCPEAVVDVRDAA
jgi:hypothetical protein